MITDDTEDSLQRRWARMAPEASMEGNWQDDASVRHYADHVDEIERIVKAEAVRVRGLDARLPPVLPSPWDPGEQVNVVFLDDRYGLEQSRRTLTLVATQYAQTVERRLLAERETRLATERLERRKELATRQGAVAFLCSVALADAMLASLLGGGPRLLARSEDPVKERGLQEARAQAWDLTPGEPTVVSLHEVALLLEQRVRRVT
jgi:hypothetical protein